MLMVDYKGRSDAFGVPRMNSKLLSHGRFSSGIQGPLLVETGRVDIPNFLVQGASRSGARRSSSALPCHRRRPQAG